MLAVLRGYTKAVLQNFRFYGAPMAAVVCIDQVLARADVLSAGMYLQLLTLLLAERGLGTYIEGVEDASMRELVSARID